MKVSQIQSKGHASTAFAAGSVFAAGWYSFAAAVFTGVPAQTIPVIGAIAIAALTPTILLRKFSRRDTGQTSESIFQQLQLLKTQTMVNVVDTQDLLVEGNDQLLTATGYSCEELIGQPVSKLYADADVRLGNDIRSQLVQGSGWQAKAFCAGVTVVPALPRQRSPFFWTLQGTG